MKERGYGACTGTPVRQTAGGLPAHDPKDWLPQALSSQPWIRAQSESWEPVYLPLFHLLSASPCEWHAVHLSETLGTSQHQTRGLRWHAPCPKESIIVFLDFQVYRHVYECAHGELWEQRHADLYVDTNEVEIWKWERVNKPLVKCNLALIGLPLFIKQSSACQTHAFQSVKQRSALWWHPQPRGPPQIPTLTLNVATSETDCNLTLGKLFIMKYITKKLLE